MMVVCKPARRVMFSGSAGMVEVHRPLASRVERSARHVAAGDTALIDGRVPQHVQSALARLQITHLRHVAGREDVLFVARP